MSNSAHVVTGDSLYNITSFIKQGLKFTLMLYDTQYNLIQKRYHIFRMDPHSIVLVIQNYKFRSTGNMTCPTPKRESYQFLKDLKTQESEEI